MMTLSTENRDRLRDCLLQVIPSLEECPEKNLFQLTLALISDVEKQESVLQCVTSMVEVTGLMGELLHTFWL